MHTTMPSVAMPRPRVRRTFVLFYDTVAGTFIEVPCKSPLQEVGVCFEMYARHVGKHADGLDFTIRGRRIRRRTQVSDLPKDAYIRVGKPTVCRVVHNGKRWFVRTRRRSKTLRDVMRYIQATLQCPPIDCENVVVTFAGGERIPSVDTTFAECGIVEGSVVYIDRSTDTAPPPEHCSHPLSIGERF